MRSSPLADDSAVSFMPAMSDFMAVISVDKSISCFITSVRVGWSPLVVDTVEDNGEGWWTEAMVDEDCLTRDTRLSRA
jgi:hypothetical protein